eukprot:UN18143
MPLGFSSSTGQGPWSDEYANTPWCICVWAWINWTGTLDNLAEISCEATTALVLDEKMGCYFNGP